MNIAEVGKDSKIESQNLPKRFWDSITGFFGRVPRHALYVAILILSSSACFGLGILEGRELGESSKLSIETLGTTTPPMALSESAKILPATTLPAGGEVVASKNGAKYYLPWCGGVKLIKEENKVWFASKADAESHGYEPAANCKGL
ncbi:MAG: hypothetical protein WAV21_00235 [Minisyncoccia bacterium]